jgi:RNA polymerase sigma factor (sigma-70 family)
LFEEHLAWAERIAATSHPKAQKHLLPGQLQQAARVALWCVIQRYNPKRGRFRTFAYRRIKGAIVDELRDGPMWNMRRRDVPLLEPLTDRVARPLDTLLDVKFLIALLPHNAYWERRRKVLQLYFVKHLLLREIGERLGYTESNAGHFLSQGLAYLRRRLENDDAFSGYRKPKNGAAAIPRRRL